MSIWATSRSTHWDASGRAERAGVDGWSKLSEGGPILEHMFEWLGTEAPADAAADGAPPWVPGVLDLLATDERGRADVDTTLAAILAVGPGPASAAALELLDPQSLTADQQLLLIQAWEAQARHAAAAQLDALAALAGDEGSEEDLSIQVDASAALAVAGVTAQRRIELARLLRQRLPLTRGRLAAGRLGFPHVCAIADELEFVAADVAGRAEARLFARLREDVIYTPGQLRRKVRRIVLALDAEAAEQRHAEAAEESGVSLLPAPDGMSDLRAHLPAADALTVWEGLTAVARRLRDPAQRRSLEYWRGQALLGWAMAALDDPSLTVTQGKRRRTVGVVVDLPTLLHLAEHPGELPGYGPIPAGVARALAGDADWQRWVRDPVEGHLLDLGRERYRPNQAIREYVIARDQHCAFPGCSMPAWRCDVDHAVEWNEGGSTSAHNLQALCRRHHMAKTSGRWSMTRGSDGAAAWTREPVGAGRTYQVPRTELPGPP
jgi:hypothetical protein